MPNDNGLPQGAAPGTIVPDPRPGFFQVRGREEWFVVDLHAHSCTCPDFQFRRVGRGSWCKHIRACVDHRPPMPKPEFSDAELRSIFA